MIRKKQRQSYTTPYEKPDYAPAYDILSPNFL